MAAASRSARSDRAVRSHRDDGRECPEGAVVGSSVWHRPLRARRAEPDDLWQPHRVRRGQIAPYDPTEMTVANALKAPSWAHPFGTDRFGRDVLSRTIYGSRIAFGAVRSRRTIPPR